MGMIEQPKGNNDQRQLVRLFGYQDSLSLDSRGRFRVPDNLTSALHRELGRVQAESGGAVPGAAFDRLSFYFVPGTRKRIFLYPATNIHLAVESFENPAPGLDPALIRQARDYFYYRMRFVEADKQNRFVIPDGLREHADIGDDVQQVVIVAQNHWLALSRSELVEKSMRENLDAFEQVAPELLNPAYRSPSHNLGMSQENDLQS